MNNLDLLKPLMIFKSVVDEGSFHAAGKRLGYSGPYVSQIVSSLEEQLGQQLLYRTTRKLQLTSFGEQCLSEISSIDDALESTISISRAQGKELGGKLSIALPSVAADSFVARCIFDFQIQNPKLEITLEIDDRYHEHDRDPDVFIRIGEPKDSPKIMQKLFETHGTILLPKHWEVKSPDDLHNKRLIHGPSFSSTAIKVYAKGKNLTLSPPSKLICNQAQMILSLVNQGLGYTILPETFVQIALSAHPNISKLEGWKTQDVPIYALYSARKSNLSLAKHWISFLQSQIENEKPPRERIGGG